MGSVVIVVAPPCVDDGNSLMLMKYARSMDTSETRDHSSNTLRTVHCPCECNNTEATVEEIRSILGV